MTSTEGSAAASAARCRGDAERYAADATDALDRSMRALREVGERMATLARQSRAGDPMPGLAGALVTALAANTSATLAVSSRLGQLAAALDGRDAADDAPVLRQGDRVPVQFDGGETLPGRVDEVGGVLFVRGQVRPG